MTSFVAPALDPAVKKLRDVRDLASLVTYLHEELEWPVAEYHFEDLVYDVTPEEVGLNQDTRDKVRSIKRLRPLSNEQPWGIFFIDFVPGDLSITVLRRILRAVSIKKREQGAAGRKAWQTDDLLFISVLGEEGDRDLNLAHFNDDPVAKRATLRVVEWDADDTAFAILRTHNELQNLAWRRPGEADDAWRERWNKAFALRPREVAQTAKALASQMAQLAKLIRERVNEAIKVEAREGPLRELHAAFKEVLLHDLTEDGFADMYAQTMTYGLFAARQSRPMGITLDNAVDMIPNTNPFLRDLLAQFTTAAGLTHSLDFDELGVDALVEALNRANMEAVVADFGRSKQGEDPVIHFYEDFLREYNKAQKIQRGVFYTPKPVVSFIVRSVHELLQTDFQLPDGLASTETWGDMVAKFPDLKIPEGAEADTPFVQVLDPACGTGTFLVEIIDVIYKALTEKWATQGIKPGSFDAMEAWNDYVPVHLLPRIYGFELMMASYTIAHMKVGLALAHYGYKFAAAERLRIYLTNTLEPPQDFRGMFDIMAPALAHEAHAVNEVKANTRFTVVVGNPPYSKSSNNRFPGSATWVAPYKVGLSGERNIQPLSDDYLKFLGYAQAQIASARLGLIGFISNRGYLVGLIHRAVRQSLLGAFPTSYFVDLHGDSNVGETIPRGSQNQNVFDIQQGVAIAVLAAGPDPTKKIARVDVWGSRQEKFDQLEALGLDSGDWAACVATSPNFFLASAPERRPPGFANSDGLSAIQVDELFTLAGGGIKTHRDELVIDFDRDALLDRMESFRSSMAPFDGPAAPRLSAARLSLRNADLSEAVVPILYRPFDTRWLFYHDSVVDRARRTVMRHMLSGPNIALLTTRQVPRARFSHALVTDLVSEMKTASHDRGSNQFPLWAYRSGSAQRSLSPESCIAAPGRARFSAALERQDVGDLEIFHYVYACLYSPVYRSAESSYLAISFPRIPIPRSSSVFDGLGALGKQLVQLHLLADSPGYLRAGFESSGNSAVAAGFPKRSGSAVEINRSARFVDVAEVVWLYDIGGYQPAHKWLKDRRGRVLTDEDIEHYKRIIGAITETIRIQKEIDEVIEAHGGWPAAFQGGEAE